jgi:valyl-tRNA synthetase
VWYEVSNITTGDVTNPYDNSGVHVSYVNKNGQRITGNLRLILSKDSGYYPNDVSKSEIISEIKAGLQEVKAGINTEYKYSIEDPSDPTQSKLYLPETDTFDTWFSSGQWPLTTLNFPDGEDFKTFYPTSVLDTMWDILFFWVARMIVFGLYLTEVG